MLYAVEYLVRQTVPVTDTYIFVAEELITVKFISDAKFRFFNKDGTNVRFKVDYTIAQSGVFEGSYTLVDEAVATGATLLTEFDTMVKDSLVKHTITYTNNEAQSRVLYGILTGWTDIKTVLSGYVGTPVNP